MAPFGLWTLTRLWFMWLRPSLAVKSLLLLGVAVALVVAVAMSLPWLRMNALVAENQISTSAELVRVRDALSPDVPPGQIVLIGEAEIVRLTLAQAERRAAPPSPEGESEPQPGDDFLGRAIERFRAGRGEPILGRSWVGPHRRYRYIAPVFGDEAELIGVNLVERTARDAALQVAVNTLYVLSAAMFVLAAALIVLFQIAERLVLRPVRELRAAAESVRVGGMTVRSHIRTGDEFQELSDTFNLMLDRIARDRAELQRAYDTLDDRLNELAEANTSLFENAKLKGEFLAGISHELRTPLNSIIGFGELLQELSDKDPPPEDADKKRHDIHRKRQRYQENIRNAADSLLHLVESMLELARLEAGRGELKVDEIDLGRLCRAMVGMMEGVARGKGIHIRLELRPGVPRVRTDSRKVQQILFNLLSNAVKFTDAERRRHGQPGLIIVRLEKIAGDRHGELPFRVRLSVLDNGPGIAPDDQEAVFQAFRQLDGSHTRQYGGAGLGLAISRQLAKMLGGDLRLVSQLGLGSSFSLILPPEASEQIAREVSLEARFKRALDAEQTWFGGDGLRPGDSAAGIMTEADQRGVEE